MSGTNKLKYFIDFVNSNVLVLTRNHQWGKDKVVMFDLAKNIWNLELIHKCMDLMQ